MKKYIIGLIIIFAYNSAFSANQDSIASILKQHVKILASDSLEGRFPGLPSMKYSEDYLISHYKSYGVKPFQGSYKQDMEVITGKNFGDNNAVSFKTLIYRPGLPKEHAKEVKRTWELNEDYRPMAVSENGTSSGEVAFAGFGISAPELKYDDYADIDAKDKIVVVLTKTPDGEDEDKFSLYSGVRYKISNAKKQGATGIIFVRPEGDSMNIFFPLSYKYLGKNTGMNCIQANRHSIDKFFPKKKKLLTMEQEIRNTQKPQSFILPDVTCEFTVDLEDRNTVTSNIIGYLPGTNPDYADKYVMIGAHYDHLGYGGPSSRSSGKKAKVHYGADDNASGVAGLLELASRIATNPLETPVFFIAFTAEEMGTLGSIHFVESELLKKEQIITLINMDMIGRLNKSEKTLTVFGANTSKKFNEILQDFESEDIKVKISGQSFGASDHAPFLRDSIPALHFFTGIHGDYHTPNDTWQKLNYTGQAEVVELIYNFADYIAQNNRQIAFNTDVLTKEATSARQHGYAKVWFGIVPAFEESELGFKIAGTSPGSPAQKAGLQKNDIIISIDGKAIANIYDFMYSYRENNPGDTLAVEVLRGDDLKKLNFDVTLAPRSK